MIVLLWDIDGTLVRTGGAGMAALTNAAARFTGRQEDLSSINLAGSMDGDVFEKVCAPRGIDVQALTAAYLEELPLCLARASGLVPPGVHAMLEITHASAQFCNGLLTGNLRQGAEMKLRHYGIWDYFRFGAFGDEGRLRADLGPVAMKKASRHTGLALLPESFWIIGDTPRDVACARACGFRCLAVGTGVSPAEEIRAAGPDAFFPDLSDTEEVIKVLNEKPVSR